MPVDGRELIKAISIIANERNVKVTMKQTTKGAMGMWNMQINVLN